MKTSDRQAVVDDLIRRDGNVCQYPGCDKTFSADNPPTIDHWFPQVWCRAQGWSYEEIWSIDNLKLMCKPCNAKKGNILPNDDGTLPERVTRTRANKSERPITCNLCESGRLLFDGEVCELCGSGPQPAAAPAYTQKKPQDCSHGWIENDHCWMCWTGLVERKPATLRIIEGP